MAWWKTFCVNRNLDIAWRRRALDYRTCPSLACLFVVPLPVPVVPQIAVVHGQKAAIAFDHDLNWPVCIWNGNAIIVYKCNGYVRNVLSVCGKTGPVRLKDYCGRRA